MHACGHDIHTSVMLGAALLLKEKESALPGRVRLIFQPAEENFGGAKRLIQAGLLNGVSAIFGMHNELACPWARSPRAAARFMPTLTALSCRSAVKGARRASP